MQAKIRSSAVFFSAYFYRLIDCENHFWYAKRKIRLHKTKKVI